MAAAYPNNVATFTQKANFVQDVDASHPNSVQDEIVAVETVLGVNPQVDQIPTPAGVYTNYGTVSKRITAASKNINSPIAEFNNVSTTSIPIGAFTYLYWTTPGKIQDSHSTWNGGASFYCPRSGFYVVTFNLQLDASAQPWPPGEDEEYAYAYIYKGGTPMATSTQTANSLLILRDSLSWCGTWIKGQTLQFAVFHLFDVPLGITYATMGFTMIKDLS